MSYAIDATFETAIIFVSLFSIIYTAGVVWRVEKKLDISYKFFLIAIIAFTLSEIANLVRREALPWAGEAALILKLLFALFFLKGVLTMRRMVRIMDGEINPEKE